MRAGVAPIVRSRLDRTIRDLSVPGFKPHVAHER